MCYSAAIGAPIQTLRNAKVQQQIKHKPKNFIERLDAALNEKGWRMAELHRLLGIAHSTMSRWRAGSEPHFATLNEIADVLGVSRKWLREGIGNPHDLTEEERALLPSRRVGGKKIQQEALYGPGEGGTDESRRLFREIMQRLEAATTSADDVAREKLHRRVDEYFEAVKPKPTSKS
jgi:transcriptional regulator with XRE-family HTH domain